MNCSCSKIFFLIHSQTHSCVSHTFHSLCVVVLTFDSVQLTFKNLLPEAAAVVYHQRGAPTFAKVGCTSSCISFSSFLPLEHFSHFSAAVCVCGGCVKTNNDTVAIGAIYFTCGNDHWAALAAVANRFDWRQLAGQLTLILFAAAACFLLGRFDHCCIFSELPLPLTAAANYVHTIYRSVGRFRRPIKVGWHRQTAHRLGHCVFAW